MSAEQARFPRRILEEIAGLAGYAILPLFILGVWAWVIDQDGQDFDQANHYLKERIRNYDKQIKEIKYLERDKARLITRAELVQALQARRGKLVTLLNVVGSAVGDDIFLTSLAIDGAIPDQEQGHSDFRLTLKGTAQDLKAISLLDSTLREGMNILFAPELKLNRTSGVDGDSERFVLVYDSTLPQSTRGAGKP
ncbi:MAG: hypothetical protein GY731_14050 [Gammaproteobacteria bacterium]|nr:hypothetical protein [Gammaproteobacteria bacterium]